MYVCMWVYPYTGSEEAQLRDHAAHNCDAQKALENDNAMKV